MSGLIIFTCNLTFVAFGASALVHRGSGFGRRIDVARRIVPMRTWSALVIARTGVGVHYNPSTLPPHFVQ